MTGCTAAVHRVHSARAPRKFAALRLVRRARCLLMRAVMIIRRTLLALSLVSTLAVPAFASPDYVCHDNRVEKGGSTQFTIRGGGSDFTIEKGGSTQGRAVMRGDKLYIEVGGSTKATIENGKIEKGGSSWSTTDAARQQFDCSGNVAGALWVLFQIGVLS